MLTLTIQLVRLCTVQLRGMGVFLFSMYISLILVNKYLKKVSLFCFKESQKPYIAQLSNTSSLTQ